MNAIIASLTNTRGLRPETFDHLLRKAAAYCWLERFKSQTVRGGVKVNEHHIGQTAGTIWEKLSQEGPLTFAALMEEVNAPQSLFFMAIGWLSREEKLRFEQANGDYLIRLC